MCVLVYLPCWERAVLMEPQHRVFARPACPRPSTDLASLPVPLSAPCHSVLPGLCRTLAAAVPGLPRAGSDVTSRPSTEFTPTILYNFYLWKFCLTLVAVRCLLSEFAVRLLSSDCESTFVLSSSARPTNVMWEVLA